VDNPTSRRSATIDGRVSEVEHVRKRYRAFQPIESNGYGSPERRTENGNGLNATNHNDHDLRLQY
jgi:hypothetical protein